jgi:hypothetical protein
MQSKVISGLRHPHALLRGRRGPALVLLHSGETAASSAALRSCSGSSTSKPSLGIFASLLPTGSATKDRETLLVREHAQQAHHPHHRLPARAWNFACAFMQFDGWNDVARSCSHGRSAVGRVDRISWFAAEATSPDDDARRILNAMTRSANTCAKSSKRCSSTSAFATIPTFIDRSSNFTRGAWECTAAFRFNALMRARLDAPGEANYSKVVSDVRR